MLSSGRGELSGTSMILMPASTRASPIASTSSGSTPRMMATSGQAANKARKFSSLSIASLREQADSGEKRLGPVDLGRFVPGARERGRIERAQLRTPDQPDRSPLVEVEAGAKIGADQQAARIGGAVGISAAEKMARADAEQGGERLRAGQCFGDAPVEGRA